MIDRAIRLISSWRLRADIIRHRDREIANILENLSRELQREVENELGICLE